MLDNSLKCNAKTYSNLGTLMAENSYDIVFIGIHNVAWEGAACTSQVTQEAFELDLPAQVRVPMDRHRSECFEIRPPQ